MNLKLTLHLYHRKHGDFSYFVAILVLFAIYFGTARLGLSFGAVSRFATLVWFPSGIAIAALLLFGYRLWPGILMGAFLTNLVHGAPLFVAVGIGIGNTLEALVGTYVLKRNGFRSSLDHLQDILILVLLAIPLSAFISATIGVSSLLLEKVIVVSSFYPTWSAWWVGDMISILILTPFLLAWSTWPHAKVSGKHMAEIGILTAFVLVVGLIVFLRLLHTDQGNYPMTYLVFPPLIWTALRFGPRGAISAIFALAILAIVGTIQGLTSFSAGSLGERLFLLQSFMGIIAVTTLILAAVMAERRELEQRKQERILALATIDPLTELPNHRALLSQADQELERAQQYERACSLLFLDLDHFKALNDGYGHATGDAVLCEFASLIRAQLGLSRPP
jgi:integral membrane sensor domain MASE1